MNKKASILFSLALAAFLKEAAEGPEPKTPAKKETPQAKKEKFDKRISYRSDPYYTKDEHLYNRIINPIVNIFPHGPGGRGGQVISTATARRLEEELKSNPELAGVSVQLGGADIGATYDNIKKMDTNLLSKVIRGIVTVPSLLLPVDHYDPMSHSVRLYTDNAGVGLHELGHAADIQGSMARTALGVGSSFIHPLAPVAVDLWDEAQANIRAKRALKPNEQRLTGNTLFPSYGSYLGGAAGAIAAALSASKGQRAPWWAMAAPAIGMTAGGVGGALFNRAMGYSDTEQSLRDAGRSALFGALGSAPLLAMGYLNEQRGQRMDRIREKLKGRGL